MFVVSRPAENVSMNTGCRVCRLVVGVTGRNGAIVMISSRVPRVLNVAGHVKIVSGKQLSKVIGAGRAGRRRLLELDTGCLWWERGASVTGDGVLATRRRHTLHRPVSRCINKVRGRVSTLEGSKAAGIMRYRSTVTNVGESGALSGNRGRSRVTTYRGRLTGTGTIRTGGGSRVSGLVTGTRDCLGRGFSSGCCGTIGTDYRTRGTRTLTTRGREVTRLSGGRGTTLTGASSDARVGRRGCMRGGHVSGRGLRLRGRCRAVGSGGRRTCDCGCRLVSVLHLSGFAFVRGETRG